MFSAWELTKSQNEYIYFVFIVLSFNSKNEFLENVENFFLDAYVYSFFTENVF